MADRTDHDGEERPPYRPEEHGLDPTTFHSAGLTLIAAERLRQVTAEGWTAEHDDEHDGGELLRAARCYERAADAIRRAMQWARVDGPRWAEVFTDDPERMAHILDDLAETERDPLGWWIGRDDGVLRVPDTWPWHASWWKPSEDPIRNLVKAGALIAAEIDRLQRGVTGLSSLSHEGGPTAGHPEGDR